MTDRRIQRIAKAKLFRDLAKNIDEYDEWIVLRVNQDGDLQMIPDGMISKETSYFLLHQAANYVISQADDGDDILTPA